MSVHPIVIAGEPVLHKRALEVTEFDKSLRTLVADMFDTMDTANGVGLAAPQIGVGLRIFVWGIGNDDGVPERGVVINPHLVTSKISGAAPPKDDEEGCLSLPGASFPLQRASWTKITGVDTDGKAIEFEATGWFARCMQHEYDHLDGKLYTDRLHELYIKKAKKISKSNGWGVPGLHWMPGVDPDPFGH